MLRFIDFALITCLLHFKNTFRVKSDQISYFAMRWLSLLVWRAGLCDVMSAAGTAHL